MNRKIFFILCLLAAFQLSAQTLTIEQCREMALQHNEDLRKAGISLERANLDKEVAFSAYLPTIDASGSVVAMNSIDVAGMGMSLVMQGTYMAGIMVTQPIYAGGKISTANNLAKVGQKVAEEQLRLQRQQTLANVDKAYYSLVSVRSKVRMLEAVQAQLDTLMGQVSTSVRADMATNADALRVQTKQSEIAYNLEKARNGESLCRMVLCSEIGLDLNSPVEVIDPEAEGATVPYPLAPNISERPELAMLNSAIDAKQLQVRMAKADYLPTVALVGGYNYFGNVRMRGMAQGPDGQYYPFEQKMAGHLPMAMLSVQIPILHWATYRKVKQAKLDVQSAQLDLEKNERLMTIEAEQAVRNVEDARRMIDTATLGQKQADENLRIMRLRYKASLSTLTDLLDAQTQWQQAHSNLIEANAQYRLSLTEYLRVTGAL